MITLSVVFRVLAAATVKVLVMDDSELYGDVDGQLEDLAVTRLKTELAQVREKSAVHENKVSAC